ncbi:MAG: hypothetical protein M1829_004577 [Trizodia sp. TS-e1964]|nr:MAG: hypothetical protein M1829_004577 [Trizodia sp. TS-e1964]
MALRIMLKYFSLVLLTARGVQSHGGNPHQQKPIISETSDWATMHLAEEHHISNYDPGAFFALHDFDSSSFWTADEILRMYGLEDESNKNVPEEKRTQVVKEIMKLIDADNNAFISQAEWIDFNSKGGRLPDFGLGPGHHGDDEYEYEIHHYEKYHDENTKLEDLTHPEDIAHFKKHEMEEAEAEEQEKRNRMAVVESNIPLKFRPTV